MMFDRITAPEPSEPRATPGDGVVGMGFFPEELRLPSGWTSPATETGS